MMADTDRVSWRDMRRARAEAKREARAWFRDNPRRDGEGIRAYRQRAQQGIMDGLAAKHGDGSWWVQLIMMFLPILIEWWSNRGR